jgi:hypothetical protein
VSDLSGSEVAGEQPIAEPVRVEHDELVVVHQQAPREPLRPVVGIGTEIWFVPPDLGVLQTPSVVLHAGAALALLLVATALAVFKPRGMTRYAWRKQRAL